MIEPKENIIDLLAILNVADIDFEPEKLNNIYYAKDLDLSSIQVF